MTWYATLVHFHLRMRASRSDVTLLGQPCVKDAVDTNSKAAHKLLN
jgi:hypothetical protein